MSKQQAQQARATKRAKRVRGKMSGTETKPRISVHRSNEYTYVQAIDDQTGTVVAVSNEKMIANRDGKALKGTKKEKAAAIGKDVAQQLTKKKITEVCFDRGSYKYHGRVAAIAEALRDAKIKV